MRENIISGRALRHSYDGQLLLDGLDFDIPRGRVTAICGPSGCGKSSLLRMICGLLEPDEGELSVDTDSFSVVFQEDRLVPQLDALDNVALVCAQDRERALAALRAVELGEEAHKLPAELSGGMRRRVAIARAMAYDGELLLCDEPSNGLDEELARRVMSALLKQWQGRTVLWITHDRELARDFSDCLLLCERAPLSQLELRCRDCE